MNRTLVRLLADREPELRARGIGCRITGVASRRLGWVTRAEAFDARSLNDGFRGQECARHTGAREWLRAARADALFEATSLNVDSGQPAVELIRAALELGAHAITANKGPVVYAYQELKQLAEKKGNRFLFEAAVMDGVPIFSHVPGEPAVDSSEGLPRDPQFDEQRDSERAARAEGTPYKLVCEARRTEQTVAARVGPEKLPLSDPLARVAGTSSIVCFETDIFPGLTITEESPGLFATAYGMLADFVRAVGE